MSYADIPLVSPGSSDAERKIIGFLHDVRSRKEFYELSYADTEDTSFMKSFLQMHGPQLFVKNFVNLNTPYKRLFINWQTGTGKTIAALGIAREFASRMSVSGQKKKIFIIGFTKPLFVNELLSHPDFGFITPDELKLVNKLKEYDTNTVEFKRYTDMMTQLKRRITDKGYQKFYGYKELATKLFMRTDKAIIERFDWKQLFVASILKKDEFVVNLNKFIKDGYIRINATLLENMKGSLIIADEIHNLYNMQTENNYGIALQYILDTLGDHAPYTVLMSATPMSGSASEIIDLLNLLIEPKSLPNGKHLRKEDFFSSTGDSSKLKEGALEKIGHLAAGRVSFLIDVGGDLSGKYPKRVFMGDNAHDIPYLKITKCPMSEFQQNTICSVEGAPQNFLYDFAFPHPSEPRGIQSVAEYRQMYRDGEGLEKLGVKIVDHGQDFYVTGPFLAKDKLSKWSAKYHKMLELVLDLIRNDKGKILVFHPKVHSSGVLLIQEIFAQNGFISEFSSPVDSTICAVCGVAKKDHKKKSGGDANENSIVLTQVSHDYVPARYITLHSGLDANAMTSSIDKFNMLNNLYGHRFRVLIGARVIREGYNFKAVRHEIIMSLPDNYPSLLQVFGRVIRRGSAAELPEALRDVRIYNLVSDGTCTELDRYVKKGREYLTIQEVERTLRMYSVDGFLSYPKLKTVLPNVDREATIDYLPFTHKISDAPKSSMPLATYYAYGYGQREVNAMINMLWVMFSIYPVWIYNDLWEAIHTRRFKNTPTFGYNVESMNRDTFDLALFYMSTRRNTLGSNVVYMVFRCGEYLVLCQVSPTGDPIVSPEIYLRDKLSKNVQTRLSIPVATSTESRASVDELLNDINTLDYPELVLVNYPAKTQVDLLKRVISGKSNENVVKLYSRFKILLTAGAIARTSGAKDFYDGDIGKVDSKKPIGILYKTSCIVWNEGKRSFQDLPIRLFVAPREDNKVIVGFTELIHGGTDLVFKLREAVRTKSTDARKKPRGAVCETRSKEYLLDVIKRLTPLLKKSKSWIAKNYDTSKMRTVSLCTGIRLMMLSLEEDARKEGGDLFVNLLEDS